MKTTTPERDKAKKLKQYKSCADCYRYEFGSTMSESYCTLGFPLEKLDEPVFRTNMTMNDTLAFEHKPKFGCVQKMYSRAKPFDVEEARDIADKLWEIEAI